uniref:Uncharacterized protein n=1 Tax=Arundo donax TaxID=35708 RepID=A0A0A9FTJ8_ARUDO
MWEFCPVMLCSDRFAIEDSQCQFSNSSNRNSFEALVNILLRHGNAHFMVHKL